MKTLIKNIILQLITWEARGVLHKYKPRIIAVTGNVGKTTTKDAIYSVLKNSHSVRKSTKSFNSEFGVPLTILGLPNAWSDPLKWLLNIWEGLLLILLPHDYPKLLVLEIGADAPGDIKSLASWIKPDIVILTRLPDVPVHVEFFDSPEDVIKEKLELVKALKDDGLLIVNHDDPKTRAIAVQETQRKLSYGIELGADILASDAHIAYSDEGNPLGMAFRIDWKGKSVPIKIQGVLGEPHVYSMLPALIIGIEENINLVALSQTMLTHDLTPGRMRIIEGIKNTVIIDDSYNSSPIAVEKALETLKKLKVSGKRIMVFGDMLELGEYSIDAHKKSGKQIAGVVDMLLTVGVRAHDTAKSAKEAGMPEGSVMTCADAHQAGATLKELIKEGDVILVKGSQSGIRTERVVKALMAYSEQAEKLLVRQEEEWLQKE